MKEPIREYRWGPTLHPDGTTSFRLWAPAEQRVKLRIGSRDVVMRRTDDGWFDATIGDQPIGSEYGFVLTSGDFVPDPASRAQTDVLGPSRLVHPHAYTWREDKWKGRNWEEAVVYEVHPGTFTPEGTFQAARERLAYLADIGFTAIEIMPLAHFPGSRGWGYDGVFHYAPFAAYGSADEFKAFVDAAHSAGLMVLLDVVYNHFGPEGNFLPRYAPTFFRVDNPTPWGPRIDFSNEAVRSFFIENAVYWLNEYRLDGLRLDAIDQIEDDSETHVLEQLSREAYASVAGRQVHLITENPANGTDLMTDLACGRRLYEADWNDDFHHAIHSAVTGEKTGYYEPLSARAWENTAKALAQGHLQEGKRILGTVPPTPSHLPTVCYVHFLQNHDQVGNRALGDRLHWKLDRDVHEALVKLLILSPQIPLFFQGDDHLSWRPFRFFSDYQGKLRADIWENREKEALNFGGFPEGFGAEDIPDPSDLAAFEDCKLDWTEVERPEARDWQRFLKHALEARRTHILPLLGSSLRGGRVLDAPDECVFVDWRFDGGTLKLRANFSTQAVPIEPEHCNEVFAGRAPIADGWLNPVSVKVIKAGIIEHSKTTDGRKPHRLLIEGT